MTNDKEKVVALVVGMRKSGTTWLYENLKKSDIAEVSIKIKESGFFSKESSLDVNSYHALFSNNANKKIEVDTSLFYDKESAQKIYDYNAKMKILVVKREPVDYAVSRYIHAVRRGFIIEHSIYEALMNHKWFRDELLFNKNVNRFYAVFPKENILIVKFTDLENSPKLFFKECFEHLAGCLPDVIPEMNVINKAKTSSFPLVSHVITRGARFVRELGMYGVVNFIKGIGLHKVIEREVEHAKITEADIQLIKTIINEDEEVIYE